MRFETETMESRVGFFCVNFVRVGELGMPPARESLAVSGSSGLIPVGATIGGRFRIDAALVQDAVSQTYRATDLNQRTAAAIRIIPLRPLGPAAAQLEADVEKASALVHKNLIEVLTVGPRIRLLLHRDRAAGRPDAPRLHRWAASRGARGIVQGGLQPHHPHLPRAGARGRVHATRRAEPRRDLGQQGRAREGGRPRSRPDVADAGPARCPGRRAGPRLRGSRAARGPAALAHVGRLLAGHHPL